MVVSVNPRFVMGNDGGDQIGPVFSLFHKLRGVPFWPVQNFRCSASPVDLRTFAVVRRLLISYDKTALTCSQTSRIIGVRSSKIASRSFATFSVVVPVDGRSEPLSSPADIRLP
jgi:hypothetical protein